MARTPSLKGYSWAFFRMNLANLLCLTGSVMFLMLPAYLEVHGLWRWQIGMADGSFWFVSCFIQPWLGRRLDRHGRRPFLIVGTLIMAVMASLYVLLPPEYFLPILCLRALQGIGFAIYLTASWTWVADHSPPERMGEMFAIFGISGLVAGAAGPVLAEFAIRYFDWPGLFLAASGMIFIAAFLVLTLNDQLPPPAKRSRMPSFLKLAMATPMRGTTVGSFGFGIAIGSIFAFTAAYLESLNIKGVSGMFALTTLASGVSRVWAGKTADRLGPVAMVVPALTMLGVGSFGLGCIDIIYNYSFRWLYVVLALGGFCAGMGYGIIYPALQQLALERLPEFARGRGLSLVTASIDLGSTAGALVAGLVASALGYSWMFWVMGLAVGITAGLFSLVEAQYRRRRRGRRPRFRSQELPAVPEEEEEEEEDEDLLAVDRPGRG